MKYSDKHIAKVIADHVAREILKGRTDIAVHDSLALIDEGLLDSLGIFLMIGLMEAEFGVKLQPEDIVIDNFRTVDAMKQLVLRKLSTANTGKR